MPALKPAFSFAYGAPGEIRTPGLLVRSQALYPTELRARKGREYYHTDKRVLFLCGEGGIARGFAARPPLRYGPLQLRCNVQNRLRRFCRTPILYLGFESPASWLSRLSDRNRRDFIGRVAEREGFEPSIPVKIYALSRGAPSTTRPPLRL